MKWSTAVCLMILLSISATYAADPQKAVSEQTPTMRAGHAIYVDNCSACHTESGSGVPQLFLALKGNPAVMSDPDPLIRFVLQGTKQAATDNVPTGPNMPAFGWKLSDEQIAAVITYVRNSWGNAASSVSPDDVHNIRQTDCRGLEARLHLQSYFDYFCKNPSPPGETTGTGGIHQR